MKHPEAVALCRFVKAVCPGQGIDQFTPDAWAVVLAGVDFTDAQTAVGTLAETKPFIGTAEIVTEVRRVRAKRIEDFGHIAPPPDLPDDDYPQWLADARQHIADGDWTPTAPANFTTKTITEAPRRHSDEQPIRVLIDRLRQQWADKVAQPDDRAAHHDDQEPA